MKRCQLCAGGWATLAYVFAQSTDDETLLGPIVQPETLTIDSLGFNIPVLPLPAPATLLGLCSSRLSRRDGSRTQGYSLGSTTGNFAARCDAHSLQLIAAPGHCSACTCRAEPFSAHCRASRLTPFFRVVKALLDSSADTGSAWLVAVNDTFLAPVGAVASRCADAAIRQVD